MKHERTEALSIATQRVEFRYRCTHVEAKERDSKINVSSKGKGKHATIGQLRALLLGLLTT